MRYLLLLLLFSCTITLYSQEKQFTKLNDSLYLVQKQPQKGFHWEYLLYIPKNTNRNKPQFLLVEPNNTGFTSDTIDVHKQHAISLASKNSIGNNIASMLKIPLLVPIFPRPSSNPLLYTHALDRDAILNTSPELKRLDIQLLAMITDAKSILNDLDIIIKPKIFMNGFSASATFSNRFSFLHPEKIAALAIGGFNGALMLPQKSIDKKALNYPLGLNDFELLFKTPFHVEAFQKIPQFIYMGALDTNDAVQFDDAYSLEERNLVNTHIGATVNPRFKKCMSIYKKHFNHIQFKQYENVGHWTTSAINMEIITFFFHQLQANTNHNN